LAQVEQKQKALGVVLPKLTRTVAQASLAVPEVSLAAPVLHDSATLQKMARQMSRAQAVTRAFKEVALPEAPELKDARSLQRAGIRISRLNGIAQLTEMPALPTAPELHETAHLAALLRQIARVTQGITALENELKQVANLQEVEHTILESLIAEVGGACPLCNHTLTKEDLSHAPVF
jgi:hypothetical protein